MKKPLAEFIGTFTLVLVGCGSAVIAGADIGLTGISFAFGLALIGMAQPSANCGCLSSRQSLVASLPVCYSKPVRLI